MFVILQKGETSVKMFDHLVKENGLEPLMRVYGLEDNDLTFIKEMINLEVSPVLVNDMKL